MAKKHNKSKSAQNATKIAETTVQETEQEKQDEIASGVVAEEQVAEKKKDKKTDKKTADDAKGKNAKGGKDAKKKKDKKNKKSLGKHAKETVSELKKVTWPTFGEVVKKTGIVIAFVVLFGLIIFGLDTLLSFLSSLLTNV